MAGAVAKSAHARTAVGRVRRQKQLSTRTRPAHAAHLLGIIHRDLNRLRADSQADGQPKDRRLRPSPKQLKPNAPPPTARGRDAGTVMGHAGIMAPEKTRRRSRVARDRRDRLASSFTNCWMRACHSKGQPSATRELALAKNPCRRSSSKPGIPRDMETIC